MGYVLPMFALDHLVFGTPDLAATTTWFAEATGVPPTPGGQHVGLGTRNHLVALGPSSYLELIGPDPDQPDHEGARPFGIDELDEPSLLTWAVGASDLETEVVRCREDGVELGEAFSMSRAKPDGTLLEWTLTIADTSPGAIPFLIDWHGSPNPATELPQAITLAGFSAESPAPEHLRSALASVGVELAVSHGPNERLLAVLDTPNGLLELVTA